MIEAAFLGTLLPMIFLLFILRHSRPVLSVFCWGMVSFMLAYYINEYIAGISGLSQDRFLITIFIAPPVEELLKMLPLFYFLFFAQESFLPFIYIFGMAAGIGFSIEENLLYLLSHHTELSSSLFYMVVRSMTTCIMHGMSTALVGFVFTYIRRHKGYYYALIPVGIILAIILHALYNFLVYSYFTAFGLLMAMILYIAGGLIMRYISEHMPEAQITDWQRR